MLEKPPLEFAFVPPGSAGSHPSPIVFVAEEGAVHEVSEEDRRYLEEFFHPGDGARPWVKSRYEDKNGWGNLRGFCPRRYVPDHVPIDPEPFPK